MTRILVADDSDIVRRGIGRLLSQHEDWQICGEAANGREAVEKARQLHPDLVVIDFAMPSMNGIEAAREIRAANPETAFVLCSMYLDNQLESVARDVGINSVLSKSNVAQLSKGVEAALQGESFSQSHI
jgi:DNA-binding NarL/FixJ family response regulator